MKLHSHGECSSTSELKDIDLSFETWHSHLQNISGLALNMHDLSQFINLFLSLSFHNFLISGPSPTWVLVEMKQDEVCEVLEMVAGKRQGL